MRTKQVPVKWNGIVQLRTKKYQRMASIDYLNPFYLNPFYLNAFYLNEAKYLASKSSQELCSRHLQLATRMLSSANL